MDALRPDKLGCYGCSKNTSPCIDEFAKDAVRYKNFYTTSTWTLPSAVSLLTGMHPNRFCVLSQFDSVPQCQNNLISKLSKNGFLTSLITSTPWVTSLFGIDWFDHEYALYEREDIKSNRKVHEMENNGNSIVSRLSSDDLVIPTSEDINKVLFNLLQQDCDQFILTWSMDTHGPYFVRGDRSFFENSPEDYIPSQEFNSYQTDDEIEHLESIYHDMIRYNDGHFGALIDKMKREGEYQDSLIILLGDHGEAFGEHSKCSPFRKSPILGHGGIPYEEVIRIPLLVKYPEFFTERPENQVRNERRQLTDILPTISDVLGINSQSPKDGTSLLTPKKEAIFTESRFRHRSPHSVSLTKGRWKYISIDSPETTRYSPKGIVRKAYHEVIRDREMLFDLQRDPHETKNRAKGNPEVVTELREECHQLQSQIRGSEVNGESVSVASLDGETKDRLEGLGYL